MARPKKKSCDDPNCLHVATPHVDPHHAPLDALAVEDDEDVLSLAERRVVGVERHDLDASRAVLTDCVFERCDLANANLKRARLCRVAFVDCRLVGADFGEESSLDDVTFRGCTLDMATFDTATLRRVVFTSCRLEGASFASAHLERVAFPESDLARCDFVSAHASGGAGSIDLRGASLATAALDTRLLKALAIRPEDAPTVVAALGVQVVRGSVRAHCG